MSNARRAGTTIVDLVTSAADQAAAAGRLVLYAKLVNGVPQMFARAPDGTIFQVSNAPLPAPQVLSGIISPAALGSNQNNYNPTGLATSSLIRQDITTTVSITGLVAQPANTMLAIRNIKSGGAMEWITISHESASSTAANRFNLPSRGDWYIPPGGTMVFLYDGTISRWVVWSFATSNYPGLDGDGQPALTVGAPSEHLGLARQASLVLGLNAAGSKRVRVSGAASDPNPFSYESDTYFRARGQFRWDANEAIGALNGTVNNQAIASSTIAARITTSGAVVLTGLTGGAAGRLLTLVNASANNITLNTEDAGSTAANRFLLTGNYVIPPEGAVQVWYDTTSSRWRKLS